MAEPLPPCAREATARHEQAAEDARFTGLLLAALDDPDVQDKLTRIVARKTQATTTRQPSALNARDLRNRKVSSG